MKYTFSIILVFVFWTSLLSQNKKSNRSELLGTYLPTTDIIPYCTLTLNADSTATHECPIDDRGISKGKWIVDKNTLIILYEGKNKTPVKYLIGKNCLLNPDGKNCALKKKK